MFLISHGLRASHSHERLYISPQSFNLGFIAARSSTQKETPRCDFITFAKTLSDFTFSVVILSLVCEALYDTIPTPRLSTVIKTQTEKMTDNNPIDEGNDETIEIPENFICPITQELMTDPVVTRYGNSFERGAIIEWIAKGKDCPLTRQPLSLSGIITNHSLRSQIRQWQVKNELDITLITHDPMERVGMFGYFMIPEKQLDDTEFLTDDEGEPVVREIARPAARQTASSAAPAPATQRPRRRFFLRIFRRGNNRVQA